MEKFLKFLFALIFGFAVAFFNAWVFSKMWGWYLVPAFHLAVPKLYVLYGLLITSMLFTGYLHKETETEISNSLIQSFGVGLTVLFLGWAAQAIFA